MKKIYQTPNIKVIKIKLQQMIAQSQVDMYGTDATGAGMSRGSSWHDDWEDCMNQNGINTSTSGDFPTFSN